jgi:hypothetical protein
MTCVWFHRLCSCGEFPWDRHTMKEDGSNWFREQQRYVKHFSEWTRAKKHQQKEGSARKDGTAPSVGVNPGIWQLSNGEGSRLHSTWRHLLLFFFSSKEWTFTLLSPSWPMHLVWAGLWGLVHWPHMHWAEGSRCVSIRVHACDVSVAWIWNLK